MVPLASRLVVNVIVEGVEAARAREGERRSGEEKVRFESEVWRSSPSATLLPLPTSNQAL